MVLHNGKRSRARNLKRYLHRNPPEADQVSAPEPSGTATGIYIGTFRNLTRYLNQHELIQRQSCWMTRCYSLYMVLCSSSWHDAHIVIQSYTYKHTYTTMQWCCTQVCDAFPWKVVQTQNAQVFTLHTFVFIIRSRCWQKCLWICGKQPTWTHTYAIIVDYTLLLTVYGLVIVMIPS